MPTRSTRVRKHPATSEVLSPTLRVNSAAALDDQDAQVRELALEQQGRGGTGKGSAHDDDVVVRGSIDSIGDRAGFPVIRHLHG